MHLAEESVTSAIRQHQRWHTVHPLSSHSLTHPLTPRQAGDCKDVATATTALNKERDRMVAAWFLWPQQTAAAHGADGHAEVAGMAPNLISVMLPRQPRRKYAQHTLPGLSHQRSSRGPALRQSMRHCLLLLAPVYTPPAGASQVKLGAQHRGHRSDSAPKLLAMHSQHRAHTLHVEATRARGIARQCHKAFIIAVA
jgi:hypothetical protein